MQNRYQLNIMVKYALNCWCPDAEQRDYIKDFAEIKLASATAKNSYIFPAKFEPILIGSTRLAS